MANIPPKEPDDDKGASSKVTFEEVRQRLTRGQSFFWRRCSVCRDSIIFRLRDGQPVMIGCGCRPKKAPREVDYSWADVALLVTEGKVKHG